MMTITFILLVTTTEQVAAVGYLTTWSYPTISKTSTTITTVFEVDVDSIQLTQFIIQLQLDNPPPTLSPNDLLIEVLVTNNIAGTASPTIPSPTPITTATGGHFMTSDTYATTVKVTFTSPLSAGRLPFLLSLVGDTVAPSSLAPFTSYPYPGSSIFTLKPEPLLHIFPLGTDSSSGIGANIISYKEDNIDRIPNPIYSVESSTGTPPCSSQLPIRHFFVWWSSPCVCRNGSNECGDGSG